jgi:hypothetical protein
MNLWVKRTGQLLVAVLFLMSCEDDSFLLGFQNKNKKFNVRYQELSLGSSVMLVDSVVTDNTELPSRFLAGRYFDNAFGEVRSETYTQFYPLSDTILDEVNATLDSMTIQFRFDGYVYGSQGKTTETLSLHQLQGDMSENLFIDSLNFNYYYNSSIPYDPTPVCTASRDVSYDSLRKLTTQQDTLLFTFKTDNTNAFALQLFNFIRTHTFSDDSVFYSEFSEEFKGLAIVPSPTNNKIFGFSLSSGLTKIMLHYHTPTLDSITSNLAFSISSFNRITTDRSTSDLTGLASYQEFDLTNSRYIQSGSPVITQLDLSNFYSFADSIPNLVINSAELVLTPEGVVDGLEPPNSIIVRLQHENNQFLNVRVQEDRDRVADYRNIGLNGKYFSASGDLGTLATLTYDDDDNRFSGFATLFFQDLFNNKNKDDKILNISLNSFDPTIGKSVNRLVFNKNSIKLKIHYTKPVSSNL